MSKAGRVHGRSVGFGRVGRVRTLLAHQGQCIEAESDVMEATRAVGVPEPKRCRIRMAGDLLWFASASLAAGLLASVAAAAVVILLAQPIYATESLEQNGIASAATSR